MRTTLSTTASLSYPSHTLFPILYVSTWTHTHTHTHTHAHNTKRAQIRTSVHHKEHARLPTRPGARHSVHAAAVRARDSWLLMSTGSAQYTVRGTRCALHVLLTQVSACMRAIF
eukprot:1210826-Pleurochrysis_carterae.AAC.3